MREPTAFHFYPRSPCGERPILGNPCAGCPAISIHALLAESDAILGNPCAGCPAISILALLAESDIQPQAAVLVAAISIHALLAESDGNPARRPTGRRHFYPRSPCGERQQFAQNIELRLLGFLSTLSLRRATAKVHKTVGHFCAYETNFMEIASSC